MDYNSKYKGNEVEEILDSVEGKLGKKEAEETYATKTSVAEQIASSITSTLNTPV